MAAILFQEMGNNCDTMLALHFKFFSVVAVLLQEHGHQLPELICDNSGYTIPRNGINWDASMPHTSTLVPDSKSDSD